MNLRAERFSYQEKLRILSANLSSCLFNCISKGNSSLLECQYWRAVVQDLYAIIFLKKLNAHGTNAYSIKF